MRNFERTISSLLMCLLALTVIFQPASNINKVTAQVPTQPNLNGKITVYPDGRVGLSGTMNQTLYGENPTFHSSIQFSKTGSLVKVVSESSTIIPPESETYFPFEVIDMSSNSQYANGLYASSLGMSFTIKQEVAQQLPLSDFSASGQCSNGNFAGALIVHLLPGFALGQVKMHFEGNSSYLCVYGNTTVYYVMDITPDIVSHTVAYLEANMTGQGPYSLYNMTNGAFECAFLEINETPVPNGVFLDFETLITPLKGTFFESALYLLTTCLTSEPTLYGNLMIIMVASIPIMELSLICETTTYGSFQAIYSSSARQFSMNVELTMNYTVVTEKIILMISELLAIPIIPPEIGLLQPYLENILRQDFCYVQSSTATMHYENRVFNSYGVEYIAGDVNAAANYAKSQLFDGLRSWIPWVWQLDYLNQTTIDITSFKYSYDVSGNQVTIHFENFILRPPLDNQTATSFQLKRFFNLTYNVPPPTTGPFSLTVEGGSNITHYVTITRPESVPPPAQASDSKSLTWIWSSNPSISVLQDLTFNINVDPTAKGFQITDPNSVSETNPFVCDAFDVAATRVFIKQASCPVTIVIKNMTNPPIGGENPPSGFKFLGRYIEILCDPSDATFQATIRIYYTEEQLQAAGIEESSLKVFCWNSTSGQWEEYPSTVNTSENYVEVNVTHFSIWALMGQAPSPLWTQPWFIAAIVAVVAIVVIIVVFLLFKKRKKVSEAPQSMPPPKSSSETNISTSL
jgi:hypothetical protein